MRSLVPARLPDVVLPQVHLARDTPSRAARHLVRAGQWQRVRRGAYVDRGYLDPKAGRHALARRSALAHVAAVMASERARGADGSVLSHESAALVWGLRLWRLPAEVHLITQQTRGGDAAADVARHRMDVAPEDVTERGGVRVTSLERTVVDLARGRRVPQGLVVADDALRHGADPAAMATLVDAQLGRRGVQRARTVLDLADGLAESPWETLTRLHVLAAGLPAPELQIVVATRLGEFRADMGWRDWRVLIEFDGLVKYTDLSGGDPGRVVFEEKRRHDALVEAGWRILRLTREDFRDVAALHRRLVALAPPSARHGLTPQPHLLL